MNDRITALTDFMFVAIFFVATGPTHRIIDILEMRQTSVFSRLEVTQRKRYSLLFVSQIIPIGLGAYILWRWSWGEITTAFDLWLTAGWFGWIVVGVMAYIPVAVVVLAVSWWQFYMNPVLLGYKLKLRGDQYVTTKDARVYRTALRGLRRHSILAAAPYSLYRQARREILKKRAVRAVRTYDIRTRRPVAKTYA